jgi:uncharacterized membrane protein
VSARHSRPLLIAALVLGYALLEHYSNRASAPRLLGALLAIGPPMLAIVLAVSRSPKARLLVPASLLSMLALLLPLWPVLEQHFARVYLLQQCGIYLSLAVAFGVSLLPGRTPLCTRWAHQAHGGLSAEALRYTRAVTAAWTLFFVAIVTLSFTLYFAVPRLVWSAFSNFVVLPLIGVMFALEQLVRRRRLPAMVHIGVADTMRLFLADRTLARRP